MARRCYLEGAHVVGVYELLPRCSGLQRNVAQCLQDYGIPLHLSKTVVEVLGRDRVEGVRIARVDPETLKPIEGTEEEVKCDCLLLSVGLMPMPKLIVRAGGRLEAPGRPPVLDARRCAADGAFGAGNCVIVHDLADDAAVEGEAAGNGAAEYV